MKDKTAIVESIAAGWASASEFHLKTGESANKTLMGTLDHCSQRAALAYAAPQPPHGDHDHCGGAF